MVLVREGGGLAGPLDDGVAVRLSLHLVLSFFSSSLPSLPSNKMQWKRARSEQLLSEGVNAAGVYFSYTVNMIIRALRIVSRRRREKGNREYLFYETFVTCYRYSFFAINDRVLESTSKDFVLYI